VKLIQDVVTRWWSTFAMCLRLLRCKPYLDFMEQRGELMCNLTPDQWAIIEVTQSILEPFDDCTKSS
jgi:hypothetical protein